MHFNEYNYEPNTAVKDFLPINKQCNNVKSIIFLYNVNYYFKNFFLFHSYL